jgi:hypothetical protein
MCLFTCVRTFPQLVAALRELSYTGYLGSPFNQNDGGVKMYTAAASLIGSHFNAARSSPAALHAESQTLFSKCWSPSAALLFSCPKPLLMVHFGFRCSDRCPCCGAHRSDLGAELFATNAMCRVRGVPVPSHHMAATWGVR